MGLIALWVHSLWAWIFVGLRFVYFFCLRKVGLRFVGSEDLWVQGSLAWDLWIWCLWDGRVCELDICGLGVWKLNVLLACQCKFWACSRVFLFTVQLCSRSFSIFVVFCEVKVKPTAVGQILGSSSLKYIEKSTSLPQIKILFCVWLWNHLNREYSMTWNHIQKFYWPGEISVRVSFKNENVYTFVSNRNTCLFEDHEKL